METKLRLVAAGLLILALGCFVARSGEAGAQGPSPVTVQLKWHHQAQFGGFYAADQNGYYAAEGLKVTFRPGGGKVDHVAPLHDGSAQFGVLGAAELIVARAEGKPLRAIAAIYRRSPIVFVTKAESGIRRPQDFVGKTVQVSPDVDFTLRAMMARVGVDPSQYRELRIQPDPALFAAGTPPVWGAYLTGFALTLQERGHRLNIIYPDDYGVHFYADTIVSSESVIATKPDLVRRFLRATLKGWTHAVENPAAVGPMVVKVKPDADPALETAKMTVSLPLINTGEDHVGWMKPENWAGMAKTLREQRILTKPLDVTQVYTRQFLEEVYPK